MSGSHPFVYLYTCGDVFSAAGLRAVSTPAPPSPSTDTESSESKETFELCPQCGLKFSRARDVKSINPGPEEAERLRDAMLLARANEPPKVKRGKKRKGEAATDATTPPHDDGHTDSKRAKKDRESNTPPKDAPSIHSSLAVMNKKVAAELVEEEKRRKGNMSAAVASLYKAKGAKEVKGTFLTMGTFTRVCDVSFGLIMCL